MYDVSIFLIQQKDRIMCMCT